MFEHCPKDWRATCQDDLVGPELFLSNSQRNVTEGTTPQHLTNVLVQSGLGNLWGEGRGVGEKREERKGEERRGEGVRK